MRGTAGKSCDRRLSNRGDFLRVAIVRFPGSNCDQDALYSLREDLGVRAEYVWHDSNSLAGFDGVFLPGGFTYGDYLRCGAVAALAPIMEEVRRFDREGKPVLGVCNGFQILCEADLLPGALLPNASLKFVCTEVTLCPVNRQSIWTAGVTGNLRIPIAHGEGRFFCDEDTLKELQDKNRIAFRYADFNPNGSIDDIAGILNAKGNTLGMMPHPERATKGLLGGTDGVQILRAFAAVAV